MPGPGSVEPMSRRIFPGWGLACVPAGIFVGVLAGFALGAWFGVPGVGAIIGVALGVSVGMALLAAAIVVASSRWPR